MWNWWLLYNTPEFTACPWPHSMPLLSLTEPLIARAGAGVYSSENVTAQRPLSWGALLKGLCDISMQLPQEKTLHEDCWSCSRHSVHYIGRRQKVSVRVFWSQCHFWRSELRCSHTASSVIYMWQLEQYDQNHIIHVCQSRVETSIKGGAHTHYVNVTSIDEFTQRIWAPPLTEVPR